MTILNDKVYIDNTSPSRLRWKVDVYSGNTLNHISKHAGDIAGGYDKTRNYWKVQILGKQYLIHRVIWELVNGAIPKGHIVDHIDGDGSNNDISNLRCVLPKINSRNRKKNVSSKAVRIGIRFRLIDNNTYVISTIRNYEDNNYISKTFSVKKLGIMEAFKQAVIFRQNKLAIINENGACYSERHINN